MQQNQRIKLNMIGVHILKSIKTINLIILELTLENASLRYKVLIKRDIVYLEST